MKSLLVALVLLPFASAFAADSPQRSNPFGGLLAAPEQLMKAREALGLSAEQQQRLRGIHEAHYPAFQKKGAAVGEAQRALRAALEQQPTDEKVCTMRFAELLEAERAAKEIEFHALLSARMILSPEQMEKLRASASRPAGPESPASREGAIKAKMERLQQRVQALERAGTPPREHERAFRELERAVREKNVEQAEGLIDALLGALRE
jgi:Spy/CpxP family protein refolding chaperone